MIFKCKNLVLIAGIIMTGFCPTPCNAGHGRRNSPCLYWTGILYYTTSGSRPASKTQPYQTPRQLCTVTIGVSAILLEGSCPQAILKFHCPNSLDYRARHRLPIITGFLFRKLQFVRQKTGSKYLVQRVRPLKVKCH